jgi:cob(I)alamin adenosyltransferase
MNDNITKLNTAISALNSAALLLDDNNKAAAESIECAIFTLVELFANQHDAISNNGTEKAIELLEEIIEEDLTSL